MSATALVALPATASAQGYWFWRSAPSAQNDITSSIPPKRPRHVKRPQAAAMVKEASKPQGPLIIAISIAQQRLRLYDANGLFAESPVSTGMAGHATPMGVFSIIQKHKWHRSNIYSGAPMPYMQRITWSGVAIHEGVLPGFPASHGCIRMPTSFAIKMWGWTRMGARVIITPGEVTPADFTHPKLIAHTISSSPVAAIPQTIGTSVASVVSSPAKTDGLKADRLGGVPMTANLLAASAELRPSVAADGTRMVGKDNAKPSGFSDNLRTADASGELPRVALSTIDSVTATENSEDMPLAVMTEFSPKAPVVTESGKPAANSLDTTASTPTTSTATTEQTTVPDKSQARLISSETGNTDSENAKTAPADTTKPVVAEKKRTGRVAVFISRKERKLYVRQNFEPLFDVPVEIADVDRPLGTYVFTARGDKDDATALHWSLISMPAVHRAEPPKTEPLKKGKSAAAPVAVTPLPTATNAAETLDRITIPADALQKIAAVITPGGSLVISDQGLGSETGLGTDFIVPLR